MELILTTDSESSAQKIIAMAKKLNIKVEKRTGLAENKTEKQILANRILNFKSDSPSSFGDAAEWQKNERKDNDLLFAR